MYRLSLGKDLLERGIPGGGVCREAIYHAQLQIGKSRYRMISCPKIGSLDLNLEQPHPTPWLEITNRYSGLVPVQEVARQQNTLKDGPPCP